MAANEELKVSAEVTRRLEEAGIAYRALIKMKKAAGREQDKIDIEHLRMRLENDAKK